MEPGAERTTREAALEEARRLLSAEGFAALSMRKVARGAGVSAPALYRHFDSKEALVWAVLEEGFRLFVDALSVALAEPTPLDRFRGIGRAYFAFAEQHPSYYALIFGNTMRENALHDVPESAQRRADAAFRLLEDRIRECMDAGCFAEADTRRAALFVWSQTHGLATLRLGGRLDELDDLAFAALVEETLARLVRALSP